MNAGGTQGRRASTNLDHRTRGRELALKYLYQYDIRRAADPEPFDSFAAHLEEGGSVAAFARHLVEGVLAAKESIDARIQKLARNWTLARMAITDRNIIRLGTFELDSDRTTHPNVIISEAVELGKKFSTAQSGKFINGILDKLRPAATVAEPSGPPIPTPKE